MNDFNILAEVMNKIKPGVIKVRNFIVDYNLPDGTAMHGPVQGLDTGYTDSELVAALKQSTRDQYNGTVSGIIEVIGDFSIEQLMVMIESPGQYPDAKLKPLYYDPREDERGR